MSALNKWNNINPYLNNVNLKDRIDYYYQDIKTRILKNTNHYWYNYLIRQIEKKGSLYWFEIKRLEWKWIITLQEHFTWLQKEIFKKRKIVERIGKELLKVDTNTLERIINKNFLESQFIDFLIYSDEWTLELLYIKHDIFKILKDNFKKIYDEIILKEQKHNNHYDQKTDKIDQNIENIKEHWRKIFRQK